VYRLLAAEHITGEWFYIHMSQKLLETLVAQALGELLEAECDSAVRRFYWGLYMQWRNPFRALDQDHLLALGRLIARGDTRAALVPRMALAYNISLG
jgi:hypothetical protein